MKKRNIWNKIWDYICRHKYMFLGVVFIALVVGLVLFEYCFDSSQANMSNLRHELVKAILSSLLITVFVGSFTKIIADDVLRIQRNDRKLKEYGIFGIGTGKSSYEDKKKLFGTNSNYPKQLSLLFLSGNKFLENFKKNLISAVEHNCEVRIMLISPLINGKPNEYIKRYLKLFPNENLAEQVCCQSIPLLKEIISEAKRRNPNTDGCVEIRTYIDEFQNNQRYSVYEKDNGDEEIYCWANVQDMQTNAIDLSLLLRGKITADELKNHSEDYLQKNNLMYSSYKSFDKLWNLYPNSEPSSKDWEIYENFYKQK